MCSFRRQSYSWNGHYQGQTRHCKQHVAEGNLSASKHGCIPASRILRIAAKTGPRLGMPEAAFLLHAISALPTHDLPEIDQGPTMVYG